MKATLFALCFLCATAAFGQSYPSMSAPIQFANHPYYAAIRGLSAPSSILGENAVTTAQGEEPLADIPMPAVHETPLGDVARQFRHERLYGKKAQTVWENPIYGTKPVQSVAAQ